MSNPFEEDDEESSEILEGFLCPICREDLKSVEFLTDHFEKSHAEEQDALKSVFKDIFSKAKKKIRSNFEDSFDLSRGVERNLNVSGGSNGETSANKSGSSNSRVRLNAYTFSERQGVGWERSHYDYFQSVRNPRLERYASETNMLIIRLHKLLKDIPSDPALRKQHEQNIVPWLDGKSVKLCPNCARSFHLARRQHHCRLCGCIMCHDCSKSLPIETALQLASLSMAGSESTQSKQQPPPSSSQQNDIRTCDHCLRLLDTRQEMHDSRTCRPPSSQIYADIQKVRKEVLPDIDMYLKIVGSLYDGESIFTISDASALRGKIGTMAEAIDMRSKRILALPCQEGSREEALKKAIRNACINLIKEKMLSLPPLPVEEEILKIQERRRIETEKRIEAERKRALEAYERYGLGAVAATANTNASDYAQGSDFQSLDNWSAHQISTDEMVQSDDPLVEQINIIKGYIKQARQDMNFDVVETLEMNLRELQREFYERQRRESAKLKHLNSNHFD